MGVKYKRALSPQSVFSFETLVSQLENPKLPQKITSATRKL